MKKQLCIRKYHLTCHRNLGKGMVRIVFLTDMHNRIQGEEGEQVRQRIKECHPDLILIGGDVLVAKPGEEMETAVRFVEELSGEYPVWYANGNHEQRIRLHPETYGDMGESYDKAIDKTKAVRLMNRRADIEVNGIPLTIYGLDPDEKYYEKGLYKKGMAEELQRTFGTPEKERYTILLSHNPRYAKEYLQWGADLTLSGHYHGGVMLLGKHMGAATPDFHICSPFCCGIRSRQEAHMIVSAGVGEHTIPVRIHNPREITCIQLDFGQDVLFT